MVYHFSTVLDEVKVLSGELLKIADVICCDVAPPDKKDFLWRQIYFDV